jgi:Spy/CpxP family protein refolding chaperone
MIRKILVASLLLCAVALGQQPAGGPGMHGGPGSEGPRGNFGQHGPKPGGGELHGILPPGRWWKNAEVSKTIGLNDGQIQKIETIFQDSRMKLVDVHATLQKEEIKLEPLLEADSPDENAVLSAIDHITAARASLEKANAQMAFAIRRVLTPEQWKSLRDLRPRRDQFRDRFPPPAGGPHGRSRHNEHHPDNPPPPPPDKAPGESE